MITIVVMWSIVIFILLCDVAVFWTIWKWNREISEEKEKSRAFNEEFDARHREFQRWHADFEAWIEKQRTDGHR